MKKKNCYISGFDLFYTLVHEFGHSLGLDHSQVKDSIMFPSLPPGKNYQGLHPDDVTAIQIAYGKFLHSCSKEMVLFSESWI